MGNVIYDKGQAPWDDGTASSPTKTKFGDADIIANNNAGVSYSDQLAFYEANPSQQGGGGIGGGVHQKLVAGAAAEKAAGSVSSSNSEPWWKPGLTGTRADPYTPGSVDFNPSEMDLGGWSNSDFIRGLAKERAENYTDGVISNQEQSISNNINQNVGNKGDWTTNIGDNNTISNSAVGNDYSLNLGTVNLANNQKQDLFAV